MASVKERTTTGWAASDSSRILSPYNYTHRDTGQKMFTSKFGAVQFVTLISKRLETNLASLHPMVPGHEMVGEVLEVESDVTKLKVGDVVAVGLLVGCCGNSNPFKTDNEQYCNKNIWTYAEGDTEAFKKIS